MSDDDPPGGPPADVPPPPSGAVPPDGPAPDVRPDADAPSIPPWTRPPSGGGEPGVRVDAPGPRDSGATRQGVRAALILFGAIAAAHLLTLAIATVVGQQSWAILFPLEGLAALLVIFVAFLRLITKLPQPARGPFFITALICAAATTLLWTITCAAAM